jgi:hypothetical protein
MDKNWTEKFELAIRDRKFLREAFKRLTRADRSTPLNREFLVSLVQAATDPARLKHQRNFARERVPNLALQRRLVRELRGAASYLKDVSSSSLGRMVLDESDLKDLQNRCEDMADTLESCDLRRFYERISYKRMWKAVGINSLLFYVQPASNSDFDDLESVLHACAPTEQLLPAKQSHSAEALRKRYKRLARQLRKARLLEKMY